MAESIERKTWKTIFQLDNRMRELALEQQPFLNIAFCHSLTINQARLLKTLLALTQLAPGGVSLKTLAEKLTVTPAAASEMVEVLVRKEVLARTPNPDDRRSVLIDFTQEVRGKLDKLNLFLDEMTGAYIRDLSREDQQTFLRIVEGFLKKLQ